MFGRKKIAIIVAEFIGTFILVSAVYAVILQRLPALFVASAAGVTLGLIVLSVGQVSGAHINPAVTLGFWTLRKIKTTQAIVYIAVQFLAAMVAWRLNEYFLGESLRKLGEISFDMKVFVAEAIGAFVFTFGIAAAVYQGYKGLRLATTIGASLTLGILIASIASNGVLNPAVALGIQSWSFSYVAGPILGAILGMNIYAMLFTDAPVKVKAAKKATKKRK